MTRRVVRLAILLSLLLAAVLPVVVSAADMLSTSITWLSQTPPILTKTGELPINIEPRSTPTDCELYDQYGTKRCVVPTSLGTYRNGTFNDGSHGIMPINTIFLPSGNTGYYFVFSGSWTGGYKSLNASLLSWSSGKYFYTAPWDFKLLVSTGDPASVDPSTLAFSNNGKYAVAYARAGTGDGIMLFDLTTMKGKLISTIKVTTSQQLTPGTANLAVTDDGQYVASSYSEATTTDVEKGLRVYDTTTCSDQLFVASKSRKNCDYKNIWTGQKNGAAYGDGIAAKIVGNPERPLNVRFKDNATISFSVIHDYVSSTNFQASTYEVTYAPPVAEPIRLLAMGDSYISGEGAYSYRDGTDTPNNKCHLSTQSYPYLLGAQYADEYHSVACSGAVTENITTPTYPNQLRPSISQDSYNDSDIKEIINANIVGAIQQLKYVSGLKPNAILLSIGGNDIHFADLVTACVLSGPGEPCYGKQSERKILLDMLYNMHARLTETYQKILSESAADTKLYVIGYPQVVNPTGNCAVNVHLDDQELQFAYLLIDRYNAVLKNAAESVGAVYVDTSTALVGHRLCDTANDGVNGLTDGDDKALGVQLWSGSFSFGIGNESYHPTAEGHRLLSAAIAKSTNNLTNQPAAPTHTGKLIKTGKEAFIASGMPDDSPIRKLIFSAITNTLTAAKNQLMNVFSGIENGVAPNALYQVVMHSDEVTLAHGTADAKGEISVSVTAPDITPGIHSVHIYTTNIDGEPLDIAQNIFIAASASDYDGDGIANTSDPEPFINETGLIVVPDEPEADVPTKTDSPITETKPTSSPVAAIVQAQTTPISNSVIGQIIDGTERQGSVLSETNQIAAGFEANANSVPTANEPTTNKNSKKVHVITICSVFVLVYALAILYKHKRSSRQSVKMQS